MDYSEWQNTAETLKALFCVPIADDGGAGEYAGRLPDSAIAEVVETRQDKRTDIEAIAWQLSSLLGDPQWFLIDTSQLADRLARYASEEQASTLYRLLYSHDKNDLEQVVSLVPDWVTGWSQPDQSTAAPGSGAY